MRTTRPLMEGEKRHYVAVSLPMMMLALRSVLPPAAAALIDVEWDGKNDMVNFYYETEQDRASVEDHNKHLRAKAKKEYCSCKSCEMDREYQNKTGKCAFSDKPLVACGSAPGVMSCGCGHCTGDR